MLEDERMSAKGVQAREWATNSTCAKITWWPLTRISIFKLRRDSKMTSMFGVQKLSCLLVHVFKFVQFLALEYHCPNLLDMFNTF
jgi:hypothetical protein